MRFWTLFLCCIVLAWAGCDSDSNLDTASSPTSPIGSTKTLEVPGVYPTIQHAIRAAGNGDFIRVAAGVYPENLRVKNKDVSLRGAGIGQTLLLGTVEIINSSETSFEGFTVKRGGIHAKNSPVRISGNEILESPAAGIWLENCQNVVVSGNTLSKNATSGIVFDDTSGIIGSSTVTENLADGVVLNNSSPTLLHNEVANNARDGIAIRGFAVYAAPILLENVAHGNGGESNYDIICFGSDTNPTGAGNRFGRCLNCAECRTLADPITYQE